MTHATDIPLTKPQSLWVKPIKIKLKLFKNLFNLFKDFLTGDLLKLPGDVIDTFEGLDLKTGTGELGWLLVTRALSQAMMDLVEEHKTSIRLEAVVPDALDDNLNEILENQQHFLGFDFFEDPKKLKLLEAIQPVYCEFLEDVGFDRAAANNICNRLPGYFVLALMDEWRKYPTRYQSLEAVIKTPFDKAGQDEKEWLRYLSLLKKQPDEPVFDETFGLRQVYIPLRGFYKEKIKSKDRDSDGADGFPGSAGSDKYKQIAAPLEEQLSAWVETADKDDALRVIAGGPGYGKSSFLKIFAAKLAEANSRVLFVPLHRFDIKEDLIDALQKFVRLNGYFTQDPLGDEKLVVIFDGLDELAMQGKVLADAASQFIREIKMKLGNLNSQKTRLQVIVSGRDIIIQANEAKFRKEHQLLHILPYYIEKEERNQYTAAKGFLEKDQRNAWWKNYGKIKGKSFPGMPKELKNQDLDKLTAQPLLNYLVALSYERGKIRFSQQTDLNEIYDDLLEEVHRRGYEKSGVHRAVERLEYPQFVRILEEIAVCAWHGDGRTTTAPEIERHCKGSGLDRILEPFKQGGIISIMAAFYFRKAGQQVTGEDTFEFTHKSFGEFLAGRRIVNKIRQIHKNHRVRETNFDEGWGDKECLTEWIKLFGPKELDWDLLKFIENEMKALGQKNKEEVKGLQATVIRLMNHMLKNGMPMETVVSSQGARYPYYEENHQTINAEKALLIMLSIIADITGEISNIEWPSPTAFGELISRLQGQRTGGENFILKFLNRLNLENAILHLKDFLQANFRGSNLRMAKLEFANLIVANLSGADLSGADLSRADLREADLSGANLSGADLMRSDLSGADLREADLRRDDLSGADLRGAKVTKKQLKEARIDESTKQ